MTKVAINRCFGGFGLSEKAFELLLERKGIEYEKRPAEYSMRSKEHDYYHKDHWGEDDHYLSHYEFTQDRSDADLIQVIEQLGVKEAGGWASNLKIVDIPDDVEWQIEDYDGLEHVAERHRTWQ